MKHAKGIIIACWIVIFVTFAGLLVWALTGYLFGIDTGLRLKDGINFGFRLERLSGPYERVGEYTVPAGGIDAVNVSWAAGSVTVVPYDGDDIRLVDYAQRELKDDEILAFSAEDGTLSIRCYEAGRLALAPVKRLELFVPAALAGDLRRLKLDVSSADVSISGLRLGELEVDTTSGLTEISDTVSGSIEVDGTSGNVILRNIEAVSIGVGVVSGLTEISDTVSGSIETNGTSGNVIFVNVGAENVRDERISGRVNFQGSFGSVNAGTTSGSIEISSLREPDRIKCDTVSGDVTVFVPDSGGVSVSHDSVSGGFDSELAVRLVKNDAKFSFNTTSGDVELRVLTP